MRKITKPSFDVREVYSACISKVANVNLKNQLINIQHIFVASELKFETAIQNNTLYTLPKNDNVGGILTKEIKKIYTYRMVDKEQAGRPYYNAILLSAPHGKCPLCSQRIATTLDHHLAKSEYPEFVVTPINLLPCCSDCNKIKDTLSPTSNSEETFHPYFDDITGVWLSASIIQTQPITITYDTVNMTNQQSLLDRRIAYHFKMLELEKLYAVHAGESLSNILFKLHNLYNQGGKEQVKAYLEEEFESRFNNNKNSWETAMYKALYESDWFCDGGFL